MIPQPEVLPVWRIANLWADELRGTEREVHHPDALEEWMYRAFFDGRLRICGPEADYVRALGPADFLSETKFRFSKPERDEFLRWVEAEGFPRPKFWGAEPLAKPAKPAKPAKSADIDAWLTKQFETGVRPGTTVEYKELVVEAKEIFGNRKSISQRTFRRRFDAFTGKSAKP